MSLPYAQTGGDADSFPRVSGDEPIRDDLDALINEVFPA